MVAVIIIILIRGGEMIIWIVRIRKRIMIRIMIGIIIRITI